MGVPQPDRTLRDDDGDGDVNVAFVLGTGRCGSTLIHEVLCRHRDVGFCSNLLDRSPVFRIVEPFNNRVFRSLPLGANQRGPVHFMPSEAYRALERSVSPLLADPMRDLSSADATPWIVTRLRQFFAERARNAKKPALLHKFTGWPRVGLLDVAFPHAKYVHVVRDGRAVANSWLQMPWWRGYRGPDQWHFGPLPEDYEREWVDGGRSFVLLAGIAWKMLMDSYCEARALVDRSRWLEIRYEDVVANPAELMEDVSRFLGLEADPGFARQLARVRFDAARRAAFRADLGAESTRVLTASLQQHLERAGYIAYDDVR